MHGNNLSFDFNIEGTVFQVMNPISMHGNNLLFDFNIGENLKVFQVISPIAINGNNLIRLSIEENLNSFPGKVISPISMHGSNLSFDFNIEENFFEEQFSR